MNDLIDLYDAFGGFIRDHYHRTVMTDEDVDEMITELVDTVRDTEDE
jgi:hypothetical protein